MNVFITGASSGIGEALALQYANEYSHATVNLGLVARRSERLHKLQTLLNSISNVSCKIYVLDVRDSQALANAAHDFMQTYGAPDIVIANAGVSRGTLTEYVEDIAAFQSVMDINVMGLVHTFQPFISAMQQQKSGSLVGIASVAGIRGLPGAGAYSASKAAAIAYLESLRVEMQHFGLHVTTIAPGYIRTPMTAVNPYTMPFIMDADVAATKFIKAIASKKRFIVIPWQMGVVAKILRLIPTAVWDFIMKKAPHKPRVLD